jgi:hypothetical protein
MKVISVVPDFLSYDDPVESELQQTNAVATGVLETCHYVSLERRV